MKAGTDVWCSRSTDGLPNHHIRPLILDMFASYSGPDKGLAVVPELPIVQPGWLQYWSVASDTFSEQTLFIKSNSKCTVCSVAVVFVS